MSSISSGTAGSVPIDPVLYLKGNTGGDVGPDALGVIQVVGSGNITVSGNAGTNTETISFTGVLPIANGGTNANAMANTYGVNYFDGTRIVTTAVGTAGHILTSNGAGVAPTFQAAAASSITITGDIGGGLVGNSFTFTGGATGLSFSGAGTTETLGGTLVVGNGGTGRATLTNHGLLVGAGTSAITQLAAATDGQIPIGSTGADPVLANITGSGNITVTNGAGTIALSVTGAASFVWSVISADQTAAVNNGYFCNKAGTLLLALPAVSAVGDVIEVSNINTALGIQLTQAAGQQIFIANTSTTSGATGTLTSSAVGDSLKLVCRVANLTWQVVSMVGNWTPA